MKKPALTNLPNIGKIAAQKLIQVGIDSEQTLKEVGSQNAFLRIKTIDPDACICLLMALEGAIEGIRWHDLSTEKKAELKEFFKIKS